MSRTWLGVAGILGALGVGLGAFGAHGLQSVLTPHQMSIFETSVRYHLFHVLALLGTSLAMQAFPQHVTGLRRTAIAFAVGILVFSSSLYLLVFTGQRWFGAITPIGGVALILGWLGLAVVFLRRVK